MQAHSNTKDISIISINLFPVLWYYRSDTSATTLQRLQSLMGSILGDMSKKAKGPGAVSPESLKAQLEAMGGHLGPGFIGCKKCRAGR